MKIVVLAGGFSPERDVSLSSGAMIANALLDNGHEVLLLDVYLGIEWDGNTQTLFKSGKDAARYVFSVPTVEPNLPALKASSGNGEALIGRNVLVICHLADLSFIAMHGAMGENGMLQAVLHTMGIRHTGTGYTGCLLAMDKSISKQLMEHHGISTPKWMLYRPHTDNTSVIIQKIGLPCVVKPCACGSSVGVSIVRTAEELQDAILLAQKYEDCLLIETMITGREFSVGILDGDPLPLIEIIPKSGFYGYADKYQAGATEEICPANLPPALAEKIQAVAIQVHNALHLHAYSRVDFLLDNQNRFYCLEANTLPGMTPTSLLPQEACAAGISYRELCEKIVNAAFDKE